MRVKATIVMLGRMILTRPLPCRNQASGGDVKNHWTDDGETRGCAVARQHMKNAFRDPHAYDRDTGRCLS